MNMNSNIKDELMKVKEQLEADGTECSEVREIEPGVFQLTIGSDRSGN